MSKYAEQITAYEAKRASLVAGMEAIMERAGKEGATLDTAEQEEYDGFDRDIEAVGGHLKRLRTLETALAASAKPVNGSTAKAGTESRVAAQVKANPTVAPGIRFARIVKALGMARGNLPHAAQIAEHRWPNDDQVVSTLKTAVEAGTTIAGNWATELVGAEGGPIGDFIEFLRPMTILGKFGLNGVPSLRRVPFRVRLVGQTVGGAANWTGEGKPKPLTKFGFSDTTLLPLKVAAITVISEEVIRDSSPSAEMIVRDQLAETIKERLDTDFVNPSKIAVSGVSPAGITHGIAAILSSGDDADAVRADVKAAFSAFIAAENTPSSGVWIMPMTTALSLSMMANALGQPEFPGLTMMGGTFAGLPVITSEYVITDTSGAQVILANAQDIYLGDDGGIAIDMSREASLQMDDAPATQDATTGTGTSLVSMFQTNTVAFRAERTINWARRRDTSVQLIDGVNWGEAA